MKTYAKILTLAGVLLSAVLLASMLTACGWFPSLHANTSAAEDTASVTQAPPYTVTLVCACPEGYTFSGGNTVQMIECVEEFIPVEVSVEKDFVYEGYEINGTVFSDPVIRLSGELTEDLTVTVLVSYLTDELPVVSIHTGGVPVDSKEYVDMTMTLTGTDDPLIGISGSIRLRGNSTYAYSKKPYRIKLDQKHSLFGLDKAKSWVIALLRIPVLIHGLVDSITDRLDGVGDRSVQIKDQRANMFCAHSN